MTGNYSWSGSGGSFSISVDEFSLQRFDVDSAKSTELLTSEELLHGVFIYRQRVYYFGTQFSVDGDFQLDDGFGLYWTSPDGKQQGQLELSEPDFGFLADLAPAGDDDESTLVFPVRLYPLTLDGQTLYCRALVQYRSSASAAYNLLVAIDLDSGEVSAVGLSGFDDVSSFIPIEVYDGMVYYRYTQDGELLIARQPLASKLKASDSEELLALDNANYAIVATARISSDGQLYVATYEYPLDGGNHDSTGQSALVAIDIKSGENQAVAAKFKHNAGQMGETVIALGYYDGYLFYAAYWYDDDDQRHYAVYSYNLKGEEQTEIDSGDGIAYLMPNLTDSDWLYYYIYDPGSTSSSQARQYRIDYRDAAAEPERVRLN